MNTHKLFSDFNSTIQLKDSKIAKLKTNRNALRDRIRTYFEEHNWDAPRFYSQGSFSLGTNLNPIKKVTSDGDVKEAYDLDDGVYFICPKEERKEPATYHDRIRKAVDGHTDKVIDKTTCIRVVYADGHHIDLPSYWLETDGDTPQLAHLSKGYIDSDPKAFKNWVSDKISNANSNGQLRRVIRYFKAWKDFREDKNSNLKLPSGFILTILVCRNFSKNDRDDLAFKSTAEGIKAALDSSFTCYRPTEPTNEDLMTEYSQSTILKELRDLINNALRAIDSDYEKESSEFWRKVFGERFPLGKGEGDDTEKSSSIYPTRIKVSAPWLSR